MKKEQNELISVFKKNKIKYSEFSRTTGISRARLYSYFTKKKADFSAYEIALLCSLLPIEPDFFGKETADIYTYKRTKEYDSVLSYRYLKDRSGSDVSSYNEFFKKYFNALIDEVRKAKESIIILDYVGDNHYIASKTTENENERSPYHVHYEKFLEEINIFIKNKSKAANTTEPTFVRILQSPINKIKKVINFDDPMDEALDLAYNDMFEQFNKLTKRGYRDYVKLYLAQKAFRPYSVMIIDGKTILTEYVSHNIRGECYPDILFVDHVHNEGSKNDVANVLITTHMDSINRIINDSKFEIDRTTAKVSLMRICRRYEDELIRVKNARKKMDTIVGQVNDLEKIASRINKMAYIVSQSLQINDIEDLKNLVDEFKLKKHLLKKRIALTKKKIKSFNQQEPHV